MFFSRLAESRPDVDVSGEDVDQKRGIKRFTIGSNATGYE